MEKEILVKIREVTHFSDGTFEKMKENWGYQGNVYEFNSILSAQFNQLKGKLYNLVESSVTDEKQRNAMKGLVKDFCNDKYKNAITDLENWVERMGFVMENYPRGSQPLENE